LFNSNSLYPSLQALRSKNQELNQQLEELQAAAPEEGASAAAGAAAAAEQSSARQDALRQEMGLTFTVEQQLLVGGRGVCWGWT
jgi:hypothetical protein